MLGEILFIIYLAIVLQYRNLCLLLYLPALKLRETLLEIFIESRFLFIWCKHILLNEIKL